MSLLRLLLIPIRTQRDQRNTLYALDEGDGSFGFTETYFGMKFSTGVVVDEHVGGQFLASLLPSPLLSLLNQPPSNVLLLISFPYINTFQVPHGFMLRSGHIVVPKGKIHEANGHALFIPDQKRRFLRRLTDGIQYRSHVVIGVIRLQPQG